MSNIDYSELVAIQPIEANISLSGRYIIDIVKYGFVNLQNTYLTMIIFKPFPQSHNLNFGANEIHIFNRILQKCGFVLSSVNNSFMFMTLYHQNPFDIKILLEKPIGLNGLTDESIDNWINIYAPVIFRIEYDPKNTKQGILYDVCASSKGKEILVNGVPVFKLTQVVFKNTIDFLCQNEFDLALGVVLDNPYYEAAVKLYLKAGFGDPKISRTLFNKNFAFPFLKLDLNCTTKKYNVKYNRDNAENNFKKALSLRRDYIEGVKKISTDISISKTVYEYLKNLVEKRGNETAGGFFLQQSPQNSHEYDLQYICEYELKNPDNKPNFEAEPPIVPIYYHTHPDVCNIKFGCLHSWPSSEDFNADFFRTIYFGNNKIPTLSLVCSREGLYFQQHSSFFMKLISGLQQQDNRNVIALIMFYVIYIHGPRLGRLREQATQVYENVLYDATLYYVNEINNINIQNMLEYMNDKLPILLNDMSFINTLSSISLGPFSLIFPLSGNDYLVTFLNTILNANRNPTTIKNALQDFLNNFNSYIKQVNGYLTNLKEKDYNLGLLVPMRTTLKPELEYIFISTFLDDFIRNPNTDKAVFAYYNYNGFYRIEQTSNNVSYLKGDVRDFTYPLTDKKLLLDNAATGVENVGCRNIYVPRNQTDNTFNYFK